mmetsp:Transcript_117320/g.269510  ORF Transcript_117320/g.269510 Transcript_117320/m.269510 type:complete len:417 (+) Transcript_117320:3778-5028(+)
MQPNTELILATEGCNRLPSAVKLGSNPPQIRRIVVGIVLDIVLADQLGSVDVVGCDTDDLPSELLERGVCIEIGLGDAIHLGRLVHANEHVGVLQPVCCLFLIGHIPHGNLCIQRIGQILLKLTLNRGLMSEHTQIEIQRLVSSDQSRIPLRVQPRSASTAKNLQHIQDPQIVKSSFLRVVDIRALDNHRPCGQIHAPRKGRCAAQHTDAPIEKALLHHVAVLTEQPGMVHSECLHEQAVDFLVARLLHLELDLVISLNFHCWPCEAGDLLLLLRHPDQGLRCLGCLRPGVNEHHHLVTGLDRLPDLVIAHLIESGHPLKIAVCVNSYERPLQRNRPVLIAEMKSVPLVHSQKLRHVSVVGQRGRQPQDSHVVPRRLLESEGSCDDGLNDCPSVLVEKMHLINNQQLHLGQQPRIR